MNELADVFCPKFSICGFSPPDVVDQLPNLPPGAKILYRKLCSRAGTKEYCWPSIARLAADAGRSQRQVGYDLARLVKYGLISRRKCGPGKTTRTYIRRHPVFSRGGRAVS